MAEHSKPEQPISADLSPEEIKRGIPKLKRRIAELEEVDVNTIQERGDAGLKALDQRIETILVEIFGYHSAEHRRFSLTLDTAPVRRGGTPLDEVRKGYQRGIERAISTLSTIVEFFEKKLEDSKEPEVVEPLNALCKLDLHPEIERAAGTSFRDGHYANAVEDACKALESLVKLRSGKDDLSGTALMQTVFSPDKAVLKFNRLRSQNEQDEQKGMMLLYSGAMLAVRNPRAYEIIKDNGEMALEYIAFLSLLAKSLDKAAQA
jgi:uncharacterized protein (TIGR02391 family)